MKGYPSDLIGDNNPVEVPSQAKSDSFTRNPELKPGTAQPAFDCVHCAKGQRFARVRELVEEPDFLGAGIPIRQVQPRNDIRRARHPLDNRPPHHRPIGCHEKQFAPRHK